MKGEMIMAGNRKEKLDFHAFGDNLRKMRLSRNYTYEQLAEMLGVSVRIIYDWENGFKYPHAKRVVEIAWILDVSLDDMFLRKK